MTESKLIKGLLMMQAMIVEVEKFHLEVAKALLSEQPLSEQQKVALRDKIAKRESANEIQEQLFLKAVELLKADP